GIRPVVVAIIVQAVWRLGRAGVKDVASVVVGVAAAALSLAGLAPVAVLLVSGITIAVARGMRAVGTGSVPALLPISAVLAGWTGAAAATLAIFLPAFLLVAASGPFVPRLRQSGLVASILDGVTVGALALMAVVTWQLGRVAVVDLGTAALLVASAILLRF